MHELKPLVARVALTCSGSATTSQPDRLRLVFLEPVLRSIAKALAVLEAVDEICAEITLPLGDTDAFSCGGTPWPARGKGSDGSFVASSLWMHVETERLHIEVWDAYSDDVLHGYVEFAELPALRQACERRRREAEEALVQRLCAKRPGEATASAPTPALVNALRLAEAWLVRLGDHIGNGTPDDPMGRCTTLLTIRRALGLAPDIDVGAGAEDIHRSPATAGH